MGSLQGLAHVGIYTADIKKSSLFYTDMLGFELFDECTLDDKDGKITLVFLRSGTLILELIEFEKPLYRGDGLVDHFAIACHDIESVRENLRAKGIVFETEQIGYASNVLENGCKGIFFRGPDTERIEIVEVL